MAELFLTLAITAPEEGPQTSETVSTKETVEETRKRAHLGEEQFTLVFQVRKCSRLVVKPGPYVVMFLSEG